MASIGRGRGWGKTTQENLLKTPGRRFSTEEQDVDEWVQLINQLDINDEISVKNKDSPIAKLLTSNMMTKTEEEGIHIAHMIKRALSDRLFGIKIALTFTNPTNNIVTFLTPLQKYFDNREELIAQSPEKYMNFVFLLGEIYNRVTYNVAGPSLTTLRALRTPLCVCYKKLLEIAGEDEIELAASQIAYNGEKLLPYVPDSVLEISIYAREVLATRNLSSRSRIFLLLIIDLNNLGFKSLPSELQKFYLDQLGEEILLTLQRNTPGVLIGPDVAKNAAQSSLSTAMNNSQGMPKNVSSPPQKTQSTPKVTSPRPNGGRPMNSVPRAIRGSGVNENKDHRKDDKKFSPDKKDGIPQSNLQCSNWNDNYSKKTWGHDDRFCKDY